MNFDYVTPIFERELRKEIERRQSELLEQLSTGANVNSFEDYRKLTGYVSAFKEVMDLMVTVRDQIGAKGRQT